MIHVKKSKIDQEENELWGERKLSFCALPASKTSSVRTGVWCVLTLRACIEFSIAELYNNDEPFVYLEIL